MYYSLTGRRALFLLFTVSILCFCLQSGAQNIDSLRGILRERTLEDTTTVKLYYLTASAYRFSGGDSVNAMADRGMAIARKIHYEKGIADGYVAKSLAALIDGRVDDGIRFNEEAIRIYEKTHDTISMAKPFYFLAALYYNQSKYEKAIEYYLKTIQVDRITGNLDRIGDALDNIGVSYGSLGNFTQELKYYLESLKAREKANDRDGMAVSMGNIGRVYGSLGSMKMAQEYIEKSIATQVGKSPEALMLNYENAGSVYLSLKDTAKALMAFEKASQMADSSHQPTEINRVLVNTAEVYLAMGNFKKAHELYKSCLANNSIPNTPAVDAMILWGLGRVHANSGNTREAIKEMEGAIAIFRENDMKDQTTEALKQLGRAYGDIHDYVNGYKALSLYDAYRDSILSEETKKKAQELQYEYDLEKKQTEIELLAKDKAIAQGRAEKQNAVSLGLVSALILLCVIVATMYRSSQREKAAKEMIQQQAASLGELNNYKDKIFSVLAHDLRGPISALATCMTMLDDKVITPTQFSDLKPMVDQQLSSVTLLLDNLLKWSMNHLTVARSLKKEKLDLYGLVAQNISLMKQTIDGKQITVHNHVPPGMEATADAGNIDIIVRNLISNALKFTRPNGTITVSAAVKGDRSALSVSDNGIGMKEEQVKKLFTASPDNSTIGTSGEKGIGLGMLMSYEFAKANGGDILVTSEPGKGSTFTLELPA